MKKALYIASIVSLSLLAVSCQKDEFNEAYEQAEVSSEAKRTVIVESTDDSATETKEESTPSFTSEQLTKNDGKKKTTEVSIKDVSDGDDEADDGDDSELN